MRENCDGIATGRSTHCAPQPGHYHNCTDEVCCQECDQVEDCEMRCCCIDAMREEAAENRYWNNKILERKEGY